MKNLSLKDLKLTPEKRLETDQLKTVFGGDYGHDPCTVLCQDGTRHNVANCAPSTADAAFQFHQGKQSCAGAAASCSN